MTVSEQYAKDLMKAQSEGEVTALIEDLEHAYDVSWRPIGQKENNYGLVESQPSAPMAALNEIISNAIDAVLRKKYRERHGNEYDPEYGLNSYFAAADELLRGSTDEEVRIIADGTKGGPWNLTVRDTGEGQTPDDFEDTFVGLLEPGMAKQGWPFLQGQFGMGSTGVLPHCGDKGYKAIWTAGMEESGVWTWTVIRKTTTQTSMNTYASMVNRHHLRVR